MARDRAARPEAKPLRLFVAVDIPADVRESVAAAISPLRERFPGGRWVPTCNWHVTLKFLGTTWPRLLDRVRGATEDVARGSEVFSSGVEGVGAFPSSSRARVLWVGLADRSGGLAGIAAALDDALAADFEPEKRAFTPHLTVARFDPQVRLVDDLGSVTVRSEPFAVDRLLLYRSHLQRPAPVYEVLAEFPLGRSVT